MTGVRPLTPAQQAENAAFLQELRRTGNAREAARRLGAHRTKFTKRRAKHPRFAAQWEAALDDADARLAGDHPQIRRRHAAGRMQLRRTRWHALCPSVRLSFLGALRVGLEVRLAAECLGFSHAAFYHYRHRDVGFAREWDRAYAEGRRRLRGLEPGEPVHDDRVRNAAAVPWTYQQLDAAQDGEEPETYEVIEAAYAEAPSSKAGQAFPLPLAGEEGELSPRSGR